MLYCIKRILARKRAKKEARLRTVIHRAMATRSFIFPNLANQKPFENQPDSGLSTLERIFAAKG